MLTFFEGALKCLVLLSWSRRLVLPKYVKTVAIPATSFVNDFRSLRAIKAVLVWNDNLCENAKVHNIYDRCLCFISD